ncbi:MAG: ImmA/IrrE family metallo-endopeptidase [Butyricicoccus sp.]
MRPKRRAVKLSHELGHCLRRVLQPVRPLDVREQHENKANAWAVYRLIPWGKLKQAVKNDITEVWDLAEYFDVTEDFMRWALSYYTERKNYKFE